MSERTHEQDRVRIFDTTLRDGEQSPGISLNRHGEGRDRAPARPARRGHHRGGLPDHLAGRLRVGAGDRARGPRARDLRPGAHLEAGHRRRLERDQGLRAPAHPHLHRHERHPHRAQAPDHARGREGPGARRGRAARKATPTTWSSRPRTARAPTWSSWPRCIQIALDEGATTINVPDTVGYTMPHEYAAMFGRALRAGARTCANVTVSVHCHNDLGLAVANSFAGLEAGCRQVECAINGIGERAGNASLEEIVMLLHTRESTRRAVDRRSRHARSRARSRLVSRLTGYPVQPNKAIVGRNAFAHEAGIHQDGVLKERTTYEIMDATTIGLESNSIVLGKHSGRHALRNALEELGFQVDGRGAQHRVQALQGAGGQEEEGDRARPGGDRLRRDARRRRPRTRSSAFDVEASNVRAPLAQGRASACRAARSSRGQLHRRRPGGRVLQRDQRRGRATRRA